MERRRGKRAHNNADFPSKRQRFRPPPSKIDDVDGDDSTLFKSSSSSSSPIVMVTGLPSDCTVLELKSRLEMYGSISRTRIDAVDGAGYATFRSADSAEAAIAASLDPGFGVSIRSNKVLVCRAADPHLVWRTATGTTAPSKLLRAEIPLSKHGRSNKKLTATSTNNKTPTSEEPFRGREIVAYDDLF